MMQNALKLTLALIVFFILTGLASADGFSKSGAEAPCKKETIFGPVVKQDGPCAKTGEKTVREKNTEPENDDAALSPGSEPFAKEKVKAGRKSKIEAGNEDEDEKKEALNKKEETEKDSKDKKPIEKTPEKPQGLFGMFVHEDPDPRLSFALKPFGEGVFSGATGAPENLPAGPDYPVGPGDEINVSFWGRVNGEYLLTITRDGAINIPMLGPVTVNGLTFGEVKELISRKAHAIIGADVSVSMGRLRGIQVFVYGEVANPGAYKVSAVSTVSNAIMAAGGAASIGSLRKVELRRTGEKTRQIDFYDLLLKGDKSGDARLRNGDVVFVSVIGPVAGVAGNVKRPAVYEMTGEMNLQAALELAGGVVPTAYTQQVQVERIEGNKKRTVIDINAGDAERAKAFKLADGDLVRVFEVHDSDTNAVYLHGNVKRPGKYELKPGMKLSDLITGYHELLEETHLDYAVIKRIATDLKTTVIPFNLGSLLSGSEAENAELAPSDSVYVFSAWLFRDRPVATIKGEVRTPGRVTIDGNMTVKDLVLLSGGLTNEASLGEYELYRKEPLTQEVTLMRLDLGRALLGEAKDNPVLRDGDVVRVHSALDRSPGRTVTVYGQVNMPGEYPFAANMRVSDLVFAGGGAKESAYLKEAELASIEIEDGKASKVTYMTIDLEKVLAGDAGHDVKIKPYDSLFIRELIDWGRQQFVEIKGEVRFPGRYVFRKGEKLSSVIARAGGFTSDAYLKGAVFTRESVKELQQKSLDEAVKRMEVRFLAEASGQAISATSAEEPKQVETAMEMKKQLLNKIRSARAQGRISIILAEEDELKLTPYDITLQDGDTLEVPLRPTQVQVMGAVMNPAAFIYEQGSPVAEYVGKAGGLNSEADKDRIFVLRSDGTALSKTGSWLSLSSGLMSAKLDPGDTIVVPEKLDKGIWLKEVKDLTQILYQIAVTAGVLIVAF